VSIPVPKKRRAKVQTTACIGSLGQLLFNEGSTSELSSADSAPRNYEVPLLNQYKEVKTIGFAPNSCVSWNDLLRPSTATASTISKSIPYKIKDLSDDQENPRDSVPRDFDRSRQVLVVNYLGEVIGPDGNKSVSNASNSNEFVQGSSRHPIKAKSKNGWSGFHEEDMETDQLYSSGSSSGGHQSRSIEEESNNQRQKRKREEGGIEVILSEGIRRNPSRAVRSMVIRKNAQELEAQSESESPMDLGKRIQLLDSLSHTQAILCRVTQYDVQYARPRYEGKPEKKS
jgi:hypothetical protein